MAFPHPFRTLLTFACIAAALVVGGCLVPQGAVFTRTYTIDGGQALTFTFSGGGVVPQENADMKMRLAAYQADSATRSLVYLFVFQPKYAQPPRRVVVEDVTGPGTEILVEDTQPSLKGNYWEGRSGPKVAGDSRLGWLDEPDESTRIYRFTVVSAEGHLSSLYQLCLYSAAEKVMIKKTLAIGP